MTLPPYSPLIPFWTLLVRETKRFSRIWIQSLLTPIITTSLYLFIFGVSLGRWVDFGTGVPYLHFIVPGLAIMGIINASSANASFAIFLSKINGMIVDLLVSPIHHLGAALAFTVAGTIRGLIVGSTVYAVGLAFGAPLPAYPLLAIAIAILTGWIFTSLGALIGIFAEQFEHLNAFTTFALMPLIYLGGVFYQLSTLPPLWQRVSQFNPIHYIIDAFRYSVLGFSEVNPWLSLSIITAVALALIVFLSLTFKKGWRLRT